MEITSRTTGPTGIGIRWPIGSPTNSASGSARVRRREFAFRLSSLLIGSFASLSSTFAAQFPGSGPLRLIAGASPGSVADLLARAIGEQLSLNLRVPVIVENKAGASGVLASQAEPAAPPGGITILCLSNTLVINPFVMPVQVDPIPDFKGGAPLGSMPRLLRFP